MLSRLFGLIAMLGLGWLFSRMLRGGRQVPPGRGGAPRRSPGGLATEEPMVRDRVCNTFLPRARAIAARIDGQEHYFCSEACRVKALERVSATPSGSS